MLQYALEIHLKIFAVKFQMLVNVILKFYFIFSALNTDPACSPMNN